MPTTTAPPILIWQPEGGIPGGSPISNPPVYSQADVTPLILGQAYVDVVFGSLQTTTDWVLVECDVVNTADLTPLNIWPGLITNRTTAGFRVYLNGLPDTANYYLHWAVSGVNILPTPVSTYYLTGPSSGPFGSFSTFTVALPPSTTAATTITVTLDDGGAGGTFSPNTVTLTNSSRSATFGYKPFNYGPVTISATNDRGLSDPAGFVFTCVASFYDLTGPSAGGIGVPSTNFTVALPGGAGVIGTVTVTPNDGGGGGTFSPTTVALTTGAPSATFTYTPASIGAKTISVTNSGGLTNPASIIYTASTPFAPTDIAGLKLWLKADAMALSDGATVSPWPDSSGNGNNFNLGPGSIFKTNIVNAKPVVRFNGTSQYNQGNASIIPTNSTLHTIFVVLSPASISAGAYCFLALGDVSAAAINLRRSGADWQNVHYTGSYVVGADVGGAAVGVWNVLTFDWNGTNIHTWRNGTLKDISGATTMSSAGNVNSVGCDSPDGVTQFFGGDIAEVLIYNSALSTTDRQNVEGYLRSKYATP